MQKNIISLSVREIVEFILRQGSIDSRFQSSVKANEGTKIHQYWQKIREKECALSNIIYEKEYTLRHTLTYEDFQFEILGRADGVINKDGEFSVEEIKSTIRQIEDIKDRPEHWHWAQAKCYGYFICKKQELSSINIILTYCNIKSKEHISFEQSISFYEVEDFFLDLIGKYYKWIKQDYERKLIRNESIKKLDFPFENFREGQRKLSVSVYKAISQSKRLYAQAPTGTGKTMSTLFPSVKAMGEQLVEKVFYLTAKTITRENAISSISILRGKSCCINSLAIMAKEKICINEQKSKCNPINCVYANGHFDRANDAVWDLICNENIIEPEVIQKYSEKHQVCPYEISLDVSLWVDVIICDYNYVFDPRVSLKRFFDDNIGIRDNYLFLVDEAHNLVDRSREMYSKTIIRNDIIKLKKVMKKVSNKIFNALGNIINILTEIELTNFHNNNDECKIIYDLSENLMDCINIYAMEMDRFLGQIKSEPPKEMDYILEQYFALLEFLKISEFYSEKYVVFLTKNNSEFSLKLLCLDPSEILSNIQKKGVSTVFFSATLTPINYFAKIFGGNIENCYGIKIESPFDPQNTLVLIEDTISTKYLNRSKSYGKIAESFYNLVSAKIGNYMVFFPSYEYLINVFNIFIEDYPEIKTIVQNKNMSDEDKKQFLNEFDYNINNESLLAFAVMGGVFSEGIDLVGDKLIGVGIVGVGLPLISMERDVIMNYYNGLKDSNGAGYDFAYTIPGMNKVLQSSGRVIRHENDKGVILLIDDRFSTNKYLELFPEEWRHYNKASDFSNIKVAYNNFWENKNIVEEDLYDKEKQ